MVKTKHGKGEKEDSMLKHHFIIYLLLFLIIGCAAYKELKPKPEISFLENGYIEILDKDKPFDLKKDKKYFIKFPCPQNENNCLVLEIWNKEVIRSYLTRIFDDGKGQIMKIPDESTYPSRLSVYSADRTTPIYFWVIEQVSQDMILNLKYRYIAQWRFKFENKHETFNKILEDNRLDRKKYDAIGIDLPAERINFEEEIKSTGEKSKNIQQVKGQLKEIEALLPQSILKSADDAYQSYLRLKSNINKELQLQDDYLTTLKILNTAADPQRKTEKYLKAIPDFLDYLHETKRFPENALSEAKRVISKRFTGISPFLRKFLLEKNDIEPLPFDPEGIKQLHTVCGKTPDAKLEETMIYIKTFNKSTEQIKSVESELNSIKTFVKKGGPWPDYKLYKEAKIRISGLSLPVTRNDLEAHKTFQSYDCTLLMLKKIKKIQEELGRLNEQYQRADYLVAQINDFKEQLDYRQIIRILKENDDLTFLLEQYPDIDQLSLNQHKKHITTAIAEKNWILAEQHLEWFHRDSYFLNYEEIQPVKKRFVLDMEDTLYTIITRLSLQNTEKLMNDHKGQLHNIDSLYSNPAFQPVYKLTFTSGTPERLNSRNEELLRKVNAFRYITFPATAIELIYQDFVSNIHNDGVTKSHAIITHGKYYQGSDKKIKNLIAECDPKIAKWLTRAKEYRKIYVVPLSSDKRSNNKYMFRLNIQIPSEAQFPAFDVDIKLPEEIAAGASKQQWYDEMNFNNKLLKNEGRFSIFTPTRENGYECKITPLQVQKTGNNILEVTFTHPAYKVFEISVMGQKPIIRKN
jgi:hypothetical protein